MSNRHLTNAELEEWEAFYPDTEQHIEEDDKPIAEGMSSKDTFQMSVTFFCVFYWFWLFYKGVLADEVKGVDMLLNVPLVLAGLFLCVMSIYALNTERPVLFILMLIGFVTVGGTL